jgi:hypothetical protein
MVKEFFKYRSLCSLQLSQQNHHLIISINSCVNVQFFAYSLLIKGLEQKTSQTWIPTNSSQIDIEFFLEPMALQLLCLSQRQGC